MATNAAEIVANMTKTILMINHRKPNEDENPFVTATTFKNQILAEALKKIDPTTAAAKVRKNVARGDATYDTAVKIITSLYGVLFIGGLMNVIVLMLIPTVRGLRKVNNVSVFHLCLASLLYSSSLPFIISIYHHGEWVYGHSVCKMTLITEAVSKHASIAFIGLAALERYMAVCHHQFYAKHCSFRTVGFITTLAWCISAIVMSPVMFYSGTHTKYRTAQQLSASGSASSHRGQTSTKTYCIVALSAGTKREFVTYSFIFLYAMPAVATILSYLSILRTLRRYDQRMKRTIGSKKPKQQTKPPIAQNEINSNFPQFSSSESNQQDIPGKHQSSFPLPTTKQEMSKIGPSNNRRSKSIGQIFRRSLSIPRLSLNSENVMTPSIPSITTRTARPHIQQAPIKSPNLLPSETFMAAARNGCGRRHHPQQSSLANRAVTRMILSLIGTYLITWTPYWLLNFAAAHRLVPNFRYRRIVMNICHLLPYVSCTLNPMLYVFLTDHFRSILRRNSGYLLSCCCCLNDRSGEREATGFCRPCSRMASTRERGLMPGHYANPKGSRNNNKGVYRRGRRVTEYSLRQYDNQRRSSMAPMTASDEINNISVRRKLSSRSKGLSQTEDPMSRTVTSNILDDEST